MEKRNYPRTRISKTGSYESNSLNLQGGRVDARILDISAGGVCISTPEALETGRVISLKIDLRDTSVQVPCLAEVRWSRAAEDAFRAGLQFLAGL